MAESMTTLVPLLGQALLHFLWQGALIGVFAALLLGALREARPQARYAVACFALLACVLAPVLTMLVPLLVPSTDAMLATSAPVVAGADAARTVISSDMLLSYIAPATGFDAYHPAIVATWAAGMGMMSLRIVLGLAWIRRLPVAEDRVQHLVWQSRLDVMAMHFRLSRAVELRLVHALETPAATGWIRPIVLLPVGLLTRMPADLVEALLAHELAHIRRHDYLVNLLQNAVEAVLFYHPVTWWLSHRIRVEREQIADQLASEVVCAPRRLALALSELSELQRNHPALHLVQAAQGGQLMSRIEQLVRPARRNHPSARIVFPLLGLVAFSIATYTWAGMDGSATAGAGNEPKLEAIDPEVETGDGDGEGIKHKGTITVDSKRKVERSRKVDVQHRDERFYALVDKRGKHINSQGSLDMDSIDTLKRLPDGEFLWFRRDGRDWLVTDPTVLARTRDAWRGTEAIGKKMEPISDQMEAHGEKMEALGEKMEALSEHHEPTERMRNAEREMRALARKQRALSREQSELQDRIEDVDEDTEGAKYRELEREMEALEQRMDALVDLMDDQRDVMDEESRRMDQFAKPMEELGRQMELAGKPMEALGKQLEVLGEQMEVESKKAERATHAIIDDALARNLAKPMHR